MYIFFYLVEELFPLELLFFMPRNAYQEKKCWSCFRIRYEADTPYLKLLSSYTSYWLNLSKIYGNSIKIINCFERD